MEFFLALCRHMLTFIFFVFFRLEVDMAAEYSDEEEEDVMHIDDIMGSVNVKRDNAINDNVVVERPEAMMKSNVDTELWRLEVERVTPALKV